MNESFFPGFLSFFSLSLFLSYALIFLSFSLSLSLSSTVKRRRKRRDLCVINDDHAWDLQASIHIHRCLTHANYRTSNKRREKDEWWQERKEMPSILFSRLWWRCSVPHILYPMYDFLCFLYTIIQLYASINCQSIEIDRCISTKRKKKMINEDALIYIHTRLMSMYLVQI